MLRLDDEALSVDLPRFADSARIDAFSGFHRRHAGDPEAAMSLLAAAHAVAFTMRASGDARQGRWLQTVLDDWALLDAHRAGTPAAGRGDVSGSDEADLAAEAAFALLDDRARKELREASDGRTYSGSTASVLREARRDLAAVDGEWKPRFEAIASRFRTPASAVVARDRTGALYEAICRGLAASGTGHSDPALDATVRGCVDAATSEYTDAVTLARRHDVGGDALRHAISRLATWMTRGDAPLPLGIVGTPPPEGRTKSSVRETVGCPGTTDSP